MKTANGGATGGRAAALGLGAALLVGTSLPVLAQVPAPADGRVWAGCMLDSSTVAALQGDVNDGILATYDTDIEVAFVVVYALTNDNDGQLVSGGSTGPVICLNSDLDPYATGGLGIAETTQTQLDNNIPQDYEETDATKVNTLDAEDAFILRYAFSDGANAGTIEKVICHTVNGQTDCFRISPLLFDGGGG